MDVEIATPFSRRSHETHSHLIAIAEIHPRHNGGAHLTKRSNLQVSNCGTMDLPGTSSFAAKLQTSSKAASGCPTSTRLLLLGVAADCSYVLQKGGKSEALNSILADFSIASKVFENSFNVQLGVGRVVIQEACTLNDASTPWNVDCSNPSYTIANRLSDFAKWRGTEKDSFALWHLVTKCSSQPAVGIAWLGIHN